MSNTSLQNVLGHCGAKNFSANKLDSTVHSFVNFFLWNQMMIKLSSGVWFFIAAAGLSFLFSVSLWFSGYREEGVFVGIWVPSIFSFGNLLLMNRISGR